MLTLEDFVRESNAIEGILRDPDVREITATKDFLEKKTLSVASMELLVFAYAPHAVLRNKRGLDVRVGNHIAISGSPLVVYDGGQRLATSFPPSLLLSNSGEFPITDFDEYV